MKAADFASRIVFCWSLESATTYHRDNPARGQCSVTALLAQDRLGGDIVKTAVDGAWHFYNIVERERLDFTASQFSYKIRYDDIKSNRAEAFEDTSIEQYNTLRLAFEGDR